MREETNYARQIDVDKLQEQVNSFFVNLNNSLTSMALHEQSQSIIIERLDKIEQYITKSKDKLEERISLLETTNIERKSREKTLKFVFCTFGALIGFVSSIHVKDIFKFIFLVK